MRKITIAAILLFAGAKLSAQDLISANWWRAELLREDGRRIVFNFEWRQENGKPVWYIRNATEKIKVEDITVHGDSLLVQMPVFESRFRLKLAHNNRLSGVWIKGTSSVPLVVRFEAVKGKSNRFDLRTPKAPGNAEGRWNVTFTRPVKAPIPAIGEFHQQGSNITGTFLTPTGDYRYLEGTVAGDSLLLSCFDGSHAYLFTARINKQKITDGWYYSGATSVEKWTAVKDEKAQLPADAAAMYLKPGEKKLNFTFDDLDGNRVSIKDDRYKSKVVVVQIMGSWCPNCMDETAFLAEYYDKNKDRGMEIIALAYEYSTDIERSRKSLRKFQQRYDVKYPMLITGVSTGDTLRTEKTLPQLTPIRAFPTAIFIDKKGLVRKIDAGFSGPGTGKHYLQFKGEFEDTVEGLLKE
jgi:thiol-disulfide isomerase/thioredoxin